MSGLHPLLQPFKPAAGDPFDRVKAAHLLNRAGFGGTSSEIDKVMQLGPIGAVDWLLGFPDAPAEKQSATDVPDLSSLSGFPRDFRGLRRMLQDKSESERKAFRDELMLASREALAAAWEWWLKRMAYGPHPLQEKLTLFWHGHFTTSVKEEKSVFHMWNQNELLREMSAGNFRQFVHRISRDPAMLDYLNNNQNRKGQPNENYARELMELFTLGIGRYTEKDVKEAARAFTGWGHESDEFIFRAQAHDYGKKTFFGSTGKWDGDDIIEMILAHRACPGYVAGRIFRFFAYEEMEEGLAQSLGRVLLDAKFELRPMLRTLFTSRAFYSQKCIGGQIKSPVQLVIGTIRLLDLEMPPRQILRENLKQMGQVPFAPPNVKGWPGGKAWISASTLFARYNASGWLAGGNLPVRSGGSVFAAADTSNQNASSLVDHWLARLIPRPIDQHKRSILEGTVKAESNRELAARKLVQLIVAMPEYQLC